MLAGWPMASDFVEFRKLPPGLIFNQFSPNYCTGTSGSQGQLDVFLGGMEYPCRREALKRAAKLSAVTLALVKAGKSPTL